MILEKHCAHALQKSNLSPGNIHDARFVLFLCKSLHFMLRIKSDTLFLQQAILEKRCELFSFLLFSQMILQCFKSCTSELSQITITKKYKLRTIRFVPGRTQSLNQNKKMNTISQDKDLPSYDFNFSVLQSIQ